MYYLFIKNLSIVFAKVQIKIKYKNLFLTIGKKTIFWLKMTHYLIGNT